MEQERQRLGYLDIAKGIGIILVILAHIGISYRSDTWMYSFHLPLFYIVSGYCFNFKPSFKKFLGRRVKKCIIPYFCLGIVVVLAETYTGYLYEKGLKNNVIRFILQKRYSTLWFLATLFVASVIFWAVVKISREKPIPVLIVSTAISVGAYYYANTIWEPLYWNADVACFVSVFLGVGYFLSHEKMIGKITGVLKQSAAIRVILILITLAVNITFCMMNAKASGWRMDMYWNQYGIYIYTLIAAISGSLFVILLSYSLCYVTNGDNRSLLTYVVKGVRLLGKNSILYFAWHQSVIMAPVMMCLEHMKISSTVSKAIVFVSIMVICTVADMIIRNTRLRIIIGE